VSFTSQSLASVAPWNKIFNQAASNNSTPFVTIDCDLEPALCAEHDINAYPTIRLLERNTGQAIRSTRYRGPRTPAAILSFVTKHSLPILTHLSAPDPSFRSIDPLVLIAFLPASPALLAVFSAAAHRHHLAFVFGYTTDVSVAEAEDAAVPSVTCYRNADGDALHLRGAFTAAELEAFLRAAAQAPIREFREKDVDAYVRRDRLTLYIFAAASAEALALRRALTPLAKKYEAYVTFGLVDLGRYPEMPGNFGAEGEGLVVHAPVNDEVFYWRGQVGAEGVEGMLVKILEGRAVGGEGFGEVDGERRGHDEL
jgi:hypothetical protein